MLNALYGSSLQQKNSFLLGKQDAKVASDLFTLRDEPHVIGANGSRYFDNEGVATQPRPIFEKGVLKTYFIDTYNTRPNRGICCLRGDCRKTLPPAILSTWGIWHSLPTSISSMSANSRVRIYWSFYAPCTTWASLPDRKPA